MHNVYNFPNPFDDITFFTFSYLNSSSITANITVYALNGKTIYNSTKFLNSNNDHFYKIQWDGTDNNGYIIPNGLYLYNLEIFNIDDVLIHNGVYKLVKS